MKLTHICALVLAVSCLPIEAATGEEYFLSPAEKIICTIRAQNPDGTLDAVGTDLTNPMTFIMETVRVSANGTTHKSWVIDRQALTVTEGGYNVFRTHCAPLLKKAPTEVSDRFTSFFAS